MSKRTTISVQIDSDVKREALAALQGLGISASEAIRLFFQQIIQNNELPFTIYPADENLPEQKRKRDIVTFNLVNGAWVISDRKHGD